MGRWILAGLAVLLVAVAVWWWSAGGGHEGDKQPSKAPAGAPVAAETFELKARTVPDTLELSGTMTPVRKAVLSTRLSGRIVRLSAEEGDRVHAGEVVVVVDSSDINARVAQAEAGTVVAGAGVRQAEAAIGTAGAAVSEARAQVRVQEAQLEEARSRLRLAATEHQRQSFLFENGAVPKQRADQALTDLESARARVDALQAGLTQARAAVTRTEASVQETHAAAARSQAGVTAARAEVTAAAANLPYGEISAPFDGVVVRKMAWQGEMASPGAPLLEIQDVKILRLEVPVPENELSRLRLNQRLPVRIDALGSDEEGVVRQVVPSSDPSSRTFIVKVDVPNTSGRIVPGMYGRLKVPQGTRELLTVPQESIVLRGQLEGVYEVGDDDVARLRLIKTGARVNGEVEVLSGLRAGDRIVKTPRHPLEDGVKVERP